jgi:hypothetical protein
MKRKRNNTNNTILKRTKVVSPLVQYKQKQQEIDIESYIKLEFSDIWYTILAFIPKYDIKTLLSFMVTSKSSFSLLYGIIQELFTDFLILCYNKRHSYDYYNKVTPRSINQDKEIQLFESIESWICHSRTREYDYTIPYSIYSNNMYIRLYDYILFCVLDHRYQTIENYTNVLSIMRLCQLDERYLYRKRNNKETGNIDVTYYDINNYNGSTKLGTMLYFDKSKEESMRLYEVPEVSIVIGMNNTLSGILTYAIEKLHKKYAKSSKEDIYITGLVHADKNKKRAHIYNILKDEFKTKYADKDDFFRDIIITNCNYNGSNHIYSIEEALFSFNCFKYPLNYSNEEATNAFILTRDDRKYD